MPRQISIKPSGHSFSCADGDSVLTGALAADLMLPYGCRNGACGSCKGKILSGDVDYGDYQASALTDGEKAQGLALLCCATPRSDLVIEVKEVRRAGDIQIKRLPCRVESITRAAPDVAILRLKLPANDRLQYLPGQYVDLLLPDGRRRSFSLATAPDDDAMMELHIRRVPGGFFTNKVFDEYKGREILRLEGPLGSFYLREDSAKPIILLAGGTGFAPIKAIVEHALHHRHTRPMRLYWGARTKCDLYLPDLPAQWQAALPDFRYVPVLSEPTADDAWSGRTGLVHQAVLDDHDDLSGHQVYACGGPLMIEAARKSFAELGLPTDEFYADSFTFATRAAASV